MHKAWGGCLDITYQFPVGNMNRKCCQNSSVSTKEIQIRLSTYEASYATLTTGSPTPGRAYSFSRHKGEDCNAAWHWHGGMDKAGHDWTYLGSKIIKADSKVWLKLCSEPGLFQAICLTWVFPNVGVNRSGAYTMASKCLDWSPKWRLGAFLCRVLRRFGLEKGDNV